MLDLVKKTQPVQHAPGRQTASEVMLQVEAVLGFVPSMVFIMLAHH